MQFKVQEQKREAGWEACSCCLSPQFSKLRLRGGQGGADVAGFWLGRDI